MLDITKIQPEPVKYFDVTRLDVRREYYCDDYRLKFVAHIGRWTIQLDDKIIIKDNHADWFNFVDCFEWSFFELVDTKEFEDHIEEAEQRAFDLSAAAAQGILDAAYSQQEIKHALTMAYQESGYYVDLPEKEVSRRYEGYTEN